MRGARASRFIFWMPRNGVARRSGDPNEWSGIASPTSTEVATMHERMK